MPVSSAPDTNDSALGSVLQSFRQREEAVFLRGRRLDDRNDVARFIVVVSSKLFYSIEIKDLVEEQLEADSSGKFWIRSGAEVWRTETFVLAAGKAVSQRVSQFDLSEEGSEALALEAAIAEPKLSYEDLTHRVIAGIKDNSGEEVAPSDKLTSMAIPDPFALTKLANIILVQIAHAVGLKLKSYLSVQDMSSLWPKGVVKDLINKIAGPLGVPVPKS